MWLSVPTFEELVKNNVLSEFVAITKEAFLVLGVLSRKLPNFYSHNQMSEVAAEDMETWCWVHVGPMVDLAIKWTALRSNLYISKIFEWKNGNKGNSLIQYSTMSSLLWAISAALHMLSGVLDRVIPEDVISLPGGNLPWLPEFVPKIGLEIIKNGFLSFSMTSATEYGFHPVQGSSFVEYLCHLRHQGEHETSVASVCCLHGLVKVVVSVDKLIQLAKSEILTPSSQNLITSREVNFSEWQLMQSIEIFGRGGPAPGVGLGWGSVGGGFWSKNVLLAQTDVGLLIPLLEIFQNVSATDLHTGEEMTFTTQRINSAFGVCLIVGPSYGFIMDKALDTLLQVPVLKYFDFCIHHFISLNKGLKPFVWNYKEEDYQLFSKILASHFRSRWLTVKKKKQKAVDGSHGVGEKMSKKGGNLDTIHEDLDTSSMTSQDLCTSLSVEWAHQRLPLPIHWFLSPVSTINGSKQANLPSPFNIINPVQHPTDIIEVAKEEKSRDVYETLQEVYGKLLDESWSSKSKEFSAETGENYSVEFLRFQSEIHESYSTFMETLVEQFAAISYGDEIYGRQVAIYLHRCVESSVRLAAWNALSNARVLELLPPLENCFAKAEGYLEPVEDNEKILEAYVKSWVSGALDRAATRGTVAFSLVLHHLTCFMFGYCNDDKLTLRNKLAKSLLRDYSRKQQHKGMMLDFIQYQKPGQREGSSMSLCEVEKRFKLLIETCEGNSSLLHDVEKLRLSFQKKHKVA
ncbi:Transcriptional elongation regulator MINIYO [Camellia lanceoleosa]|uniref:Transcriptional elongation regulator MINIYO n=1 Tax=Camellia lanceoleosa TaxID=1840588 RepID=A0ACC0ILH3_9ERIC|nr:Transcriptional elongation regulator MINIYO [Camellia lanceoleosa]